MAIGRFLDRMCLALRASGLWLRYATLQNWIPSFSWIAPPRPPPRRNPRKGRDPILPSGNTVRIKDFLPRVGVFGGSFFCLISNSDGFLSRSVSHKILSLSLNAAAEVVMGLDAPRRQNVGRRAMTLEISLFPSKITLHRIFSLSFLFPQSKDLLSKSSKQHC